MMQLYTVFVLILLLQLSHSRLLDICSHNLKNFGITKAQSYYGRLLQVVIDEILDCDVFIAQEIQDVSFQVINLMLARLNERSGDDPYNIAISPQLGEGGYQEQMIVFYKSRSVQYLLGKEVKTAGVKRNPYAIVFEARPDARELQQQRKQQNGWSRIFSFGRQKVRKPFRFMLLTTHVSPKDAPEELRSLSFRYMNILRSDLASDLSNIVLIGDLNADAPYLTIADKSKIPLFDRSKYNNIIIGDNSMTKENVPKMLDRAFTHKLLEESIVPLSGHVVKIGSRDFDYVRMRGLTAQQISDHYAIRFQLDTSKVIEETLADQANDLNMAFADMKLSEAVSDIEQRSRSIADPDRTAFKNKPVKRDVSAQALLRVPGKFQIPHSQSLNRRFNSRVFGQSSAVPKIMTL
ncbi:hypothetical protein MIR68_006377 [Amoeboaphelidium protococcarum]|nr:hypothetical protein MIR68_006377 [Amoeboaphelidium protococcarum]